VLVRQTSMQLLVEYPLKQQPFLVFAFVSLYVPLFMVRLAALVLKYNMLNV
jgi:hypothetical protein